jgi:hypothetical protein
MKFLGVKENNKYEIQIIVSWFLIYNNQRYKISYTLKECLHSAVYEDFFKK